MPRFWKGLIIMAIRTIKIMVSGNTYVMLYAMEPTQGVAKTTVPEIVCEMKRTTETAKIPSIHLGMERPNSGTSPMIAKGMT